MIGRSDTQPKGLAVILIGGGRVTPYIAPLIASLKQFFPPHDVILFTEREEPFDAIKVYQEDLGWPRASLMRYHIMAAQGPLLRGYGRVLYMDVDMKACNPVTEDDLFRPWEFKPTHRGALTGSWFGGLSAVVHPNPGFPPPFERRPESTAFVEGNPLYYMGCIFGGGTTEVLEMCTVLASNVDADDAHGIEAVWYDESHLNRYLLDHPPAKVLTPAYCFPETYLNHVKIWHLDKGNADRPAIKE